MNVAKRINFALFFLICSFHAIASNKPVLLYSDLVAGPKSGWSKTEPDKGTVVTVWGRNLGDSKSGPDIDSYITVGGISLTTLNNYAEEWGEEKPIPGIQKISFWLTNDMPTGPVDITVTVNGITSNKLPFRINTGRLVFIDNKVTDGAGIGTYERPFNSPTRALDQLRSGDILFFKTGTYDQRYWEGGENIWVRPNAPKGTQEMPIAFVAFPNATPVFDSLKARNSSFHTGIRIDSAWYTVSKLNVVSYASGIIAAGPNIRVVGNDIDGGNVFRSGTGVVTAANNGVKVLGNAVHGGETGSRFDHAIYISGCAPLEGNELAYNHIFDNNFGSGPMIVVNHQDERCPNNVRLASHKIHSNFIDCENFPSRAIGIFDQSWDALTDLAGEPEPTYVFNNITYQCGNNKEPVFYQNSGHVRWYNNTLYKSLGDGLSVAGERVISTQIINNIFHTKDENVIYYKVFSGKSESLNNLVYGSSVQTYTSATDIIDEPNLYVGKHRLEVRLWPGSPAINSGSKSTLSFVSSDYRGISRITSDIGAASYITKTKLIEEPPPPEIPNPPTEPISNDE